MWSELTDDLFRHLESLDKSVQIDDAATADKKLRYVATIESSTIRVGLKVDAGSPLDVEWQRQMVVLKPIVTMTGR